jgi:uncharacterized UBP type Zn finger protein
MGILTSDTPSLCFESLLHTHEIVSEVAPSYKTVLKKYEKKVKLSQQQAMDEQGCEMLRIPHCLDNQLTDGGNIVSPTHRPRSTTQKHYFSATGTHVC